MYEGMGCAIFINSFSLWFFGKNNTILEIVRENPFRLGFWQLSLYQHGHSKVMPPLSLELKNFYLIIHLAVP